MIACLKQCVTRTQCVVSNGARLESFTESIPGTDGSLEFTHGACFRTSVSDVIKRATRKCRDLELRTSSLRAEDDERFRQEAETVHRPAWGGLAGGSVGVPTPSGSKESPRGGRGRTLANETRGKKTGEWFLCASRDLDSIRVTHVEVATRHAINRHC